MNNLQNLMERLESADEKLASDVRSALTQLTMERDQAVSRAKQEIAKAQEDAVEKAKQKLAAEASNFVHVESAPKKFMLRSEWDQITDPRRKYDLIMKERVTVID